MSNWKLKFADTKEFLRKWSKKLSGKKHQQFTIKTMVKCEDRYSVILLLFFKICLRAVHTERWAYALKQKSSTRQLIAYLSISIRNNDPQGTLAIISAHSHTEKENIPVMYALSYVYGASISYNYQSKHQGKALRLCYMPRKMFREHLWLGKSRSES
jgi:hypothetical protein